MGATTSTISSTATATATAATATATATATSTHTAVPTSSCASLCGSLKFPSDVVAHPISCTPYAANATIPLTGNNATCSLTSIKTEVDICRVVISITTSQHSQVYSEVWLPEGNTTWNGRTMSTNNLGVNGCVSFADMQYVTSLGFAGIGDNGGHNSSSFDPAWFSGPNDQIIDWSGRARHSAVVAGKSIVNQFYQKAPAYSYYLGCSAGGWQGLKSAQEHPADFDGIIAGAPATDFNHMQGWTGRFIQLTGTSASDPRFLTQAQWTSVQSALLSQCDQALDGVNDGILEDPTICHFNISQLSNATYNLTSTQITTVSNVFSELLNSTSGNLIFPALDYGAQIDSFRLGVLAGQTQVISSDWYKYAVANNTKYNSLNMNQADYSRADQLDAFHGNVSGYDADLSAFRARGGKLMMYHGMADPLVSEGVSQRYYLKVAATMGGLNNTAMDEFMRFYRISGMAHCSVAGISGAGAWMFGQNGAASAASNNIIQRLQDWVEHGVAVDYLTGTKFNNDVPSSGVAFQRNHCKFPYRTTYVSGDSTKPASWTCKYIDDWKQCGPGAKPRLCNADGSFTS